MWGMGLDAVAFVEFVSNGARTNTLYWSNGFTIGTRRIGRAESMKGIPIRGYGSYCTKRGRIAV